MFKSEGKKIKVHAFETEYAAEVQIGLYQNGNTAVTLWTEDEPLCALSVNTEKILPTGHFYLKEWSENLEIAHNQSVQDIVDNTQFTTLKDPKQIIKETNRIVN